MAKSASSALANAPVRSWYCINAACVRIGRASSANAAEALKFSIQRRGRFVPLLAALERCNPGQPLDALLNHPQDVVAPDHGGVAPRKLFSLVRSGLHGEEVPRRGHVKDAVRCRSGRADGFAQFESREELLLAACDEDVIAAAARA